MSDDNTGLGMISHRGFGRRFYADCLPESSQALEGGGVHAANGTQLCDSNTFE